MSGLADEIAFLSRCLEGTDIELLELTAGQDVIRLRRPGEVSLTGCEQAARKSWITGTSPVMTQALDITSPSVGVFRRTHPLRTAPLVEAGQQLTAGDTVGLLQIGALLVHVTAPMDGTVLEVLLEDGAIVGYGTALVRFKGNAEQ